MENRTHVLRSVIFFFENRADYEIRCKHIVESDRLQVTIWRTHIACWLPKAKNKHLDYVILTAFPLKKLLHKHASVSRYACTDSLVTEEFFSTSVWPSEQVEGTKFSVPGRLANMQSPTLWRSLCRHQQHTTILIRPSWTLNLEAAISYETSVTVN